MNLAIDIGNSLTKVALFDGGQIVETVRTEQLTIDFLEDIFHRNGVKPTKAVLASVADVPEEVERYLEEHTKEYLRVTYRTKVPIKNLYATPKTLGIDRLAAAVAATTIYQGCNILVVDLGTAITIDIVNASGEFLGGNITLGAAGRFRALHEYTAKLPLLAKPDEVASFGNDTTTAIQSGVVTGIVYELESYIANAAARYEDLKIIFTGGDANYFAKRMKNAIFATGDLVVFGLNTILEYNAKN